MPARLASILVALAAGLTVVGCGAGEVIDDEKTQIALKYDVQEATGVKVKSATCPSDVPVSVGTRFTCQVVAESGKEAVVELEVTSSNGDLRALSLEAPEG